MGKTVLGEAIENELDKGRPLTCFGFEFSFLVHT